MRCWRSKVGRAAAKSRVQGQCCDLNMSFHSTHPCLPVLTFFPPLLLQYFLSLGGGGGGSGIDVLFKAELSTTVYHHLWVSALTTAHSYKRCLWPRLKATLIWRCKLECLEDSLMVCPFSESTVIGSPWSSINQPTGSWLNLHYQAWVPSRETGLRSNQKVTGYSHHNHATVVTVGTSCQVGQY